LVVYVAKFALSELSLVETKVWLDYTMDEVLDEFDDALKLTMDGQNEAERKGGVDEAKYLVVRLKTLNREQTVASLSADDARAKCNDTAEASSHDGALYRYLNLKAQLELFDARKRDSLSLLESIDALLQNGDENEEEEEENEQKENEQKVSVLSATENCDAEKRQRRVVLSKLSSELSRRKRLRDEAAEKSAECQTITQNLAKKQRFLSSLGDKAQRLLDSTRDIQSFFNLRLSDARELQESALHLPAPLYIAYTAAVAFAGDDDMRQYDLRASIDGSVDDARQFNAALNNEAIRRQRREQRRLERVARVNLNSERNNDANVGDGDDDDDGDDRDDSLLEVHPLGIALTVRVSGEKLRIALRYVVDKKVVLAVLESNKRSDADAATLLAFLYPHDGGDLDALPASSVPASLGRPYRWAQWLCGLDYAHPLPADFVGSTGNVGAGTKRADYHLASLLGRLTRRVDERAQLNRSLAQLAELRLSTTTRAVLVGWQEIDAAAFNGSSADDSIASGGATLERFDDAEDGMIDDDSDDSDDSDDDAEEGELRSSPSSSSSAAAALTRRVSSSFGRSGSGNASSLSRYFEATVDTVQPRHLAAVRIKLAPDFPEHPARFRVHWAQVDESVADNVLLAIEGKLNVDYVGRDVSLPMSLEHLLQLIDTAIQARATNPFAPRTVRGRARLPIGF
jgi:Fms-interacting protein/Thoc5